MNLVLNSYGCQLSRHKGRFKVTPKQGSPQFFSPHKISSITLTNACTITSDAILMAAEHEIPMVILTRSGQPAARLWIPKFGSIATIRRKQLSFAASPAAIAWVIDQIRRKSRLQIRVLEYLRARKPLLAEQLNTTIAYIQSKLEKLDSMKLPDIPDVFEKLRGVEGSISRVYFQQISQCLPKKCSLFSPKTLRNFEGLRAGEFRKAKTRKMKIIYPFHQNCKYAPAISGNTAATLYARAKLSGLLS